MLYVFSHHTPYTVATHTAPKELVKKERRKVLTFFYPSYSWVLRFDRCQFSLSPSTVSASPTSGTACAILSDMLTSGVQSRPRVVECKTDLSSVSVPFLHGSYLQKLKKIKMFDLCTVVKPLPVGELKSLSSASFKRILNCESKYCTCNFVLEHGISYQLF